MSFRKRSDCIRLQPVLDRSHVESNSSLLPSLAVSRCCSRFLLSPPALSSPLHCETWADTQRAEVQLRAVACLGNMLDGIPPAAIAAELPGDAYILALFMCLYLTLHFVFVAQVCRSVGGPGGCLQHRPHIRLL